MSNRCNRMEWVISVTFTTISGNTNPQDTRRNRSWTITRGRISTKLNRIITKLRVGIIIEVGNSRDNYNSNRVTSLRRQRRWRDNINNKNNINNININKNNRIVILIVRKRNINRVR